CVTRKRRHWGSKSLSSRSSAAARAESDLLSVQPPGLVVRSPASSWPIYRMFCIEQCFGDVNNPIVENSVKVLICATDETQSAEACTKSACRGPFVSPSLQ